MAKTQTFGDKLKKKKGDDKTWVKVISWYNCDKRGTLRQLDRLVGVKDIAEVDKLEVTK